jgi:hypothetical protein
MSVATWRTDLGRGDVRRTQAVDAPRHTVALRHHHAQPALRAIALLPGDGRHLRHLLELEHTFGLGRRLPASSSRRLSAQAPAPAPAYPVDRWGGARAAAARGTGEARREVKQGGR